MEQKHWGCRWWFLFLIIASLKWIYFCGNSSVISYKAIKKLTQQQNLFSFPSLFFVLIVFEYTFIVGSFPFSFLFFNAVNRATSHSFKIVISVAYCVPAGD